MPITNCTKNIHLPAPKFGIRVKINTPLQNVIVNLGASFADFENITSANFALEICIFCIINSHKHVKCLKDDHVIITI